MYRVAASALEQEGTVAVFMNRPLAEALEWMERNLPNLTEAQMEALRHARRRLAESIPPEAQQSKPLLRQYPVKQPDLVSIRNVGTEAEPQYLIDITEVFSPPGQNQGELADRIIKAFELLPQEMRGTRLSLPPVIME